MRSSPKQFNRAGKSNLVRAAQTLSLVLVILGAGLASGIARVHADEAYYSLPLSALSITKGELPKWRADFEPFAWRRRQTQFVPYVVLQGEGEAYIGSQQQGVGIDMGDFADARAAMLNATLCVHTPQAREVTGRMFVPDAKAEGIAVVEFKIPADKASADNRDPFYRARYFYFDRCLRRGIAGGAWFRHQARTSTLAMASSARGNLRDNTFRAGVARGPDGLINLFSGTRALAENLQLDRNVQSRGGAAFKEDEAQLQPIDKLQGISVATIDWKPLLKGEDTKLDPLASAVPEDQHFLVFSTFAGLQEILRKADEQGTVLLSSTTPISIDHQLLRRYERQLAINNTAVSRLVGSQLIKSVAITGSDPYFVAGTDVALLFETPQPEVLEPMLAAQLSLAATIDKNVRRTTGEIQGVNYTAVRSPDRSTCSYLARLPGCVVLTNSPAQLERLVAVSKGDVKPIASLDEYKFFRQRYPLADRESAWLLLSDPTIRRWCGPRWRIADSRRVRSDAVLLELTADHADAIVRKELHPEPLDPQLAHPPGVAFELTATGVSSPSYGNATFMTPIIELQLDKVTKEEAEAYEFWRTMYQSNWRWAFDPIALRVDVNDSRLRADLTVMPLIAGSDYNRLLEVSRGAKLTAERLDLHDPIAYFALAINTQSEMFKRQSNSLNTMLRVPGVDPLSWLAGSAEIYIEDSPLWSELDKLPKDQRDKFMQKNYYRIPVAVRLAATDPIRLAVFLTALRGYVDQAAPRLTQWETLQHKDQPYVKISQTSSPTPPQGEESGLRRLAIYYVALPDALTVSLDVDVIKRAIERNLKQQSPEADKPAGDGTAKTVLKDATKSADGSKKDRKLLGESALLHVSPAVTKHVLNSFRDDYREQLQKASWNNLPILNEWKRRYPNEDPLAVHQRLWHEHLVCAGGGKYVWNDEFQTMESTVFGNPGKPKPGPATLPTPPVYGGTFGLTFEEQGLRARMSLPLGDDTAAPKKD